MKFQEIDHQNLTVFGFSANPEKFKGVFPVIDEKAAILLRKTIYEYMKNTTKEYSKLRYEDFLLESRKKLEIIQMEFIKRLNLNPMETPIFDYEF